MIPELIEGAALPLDMTNTWLVLDPAQMGRYYAPLNRRTVFCYDAYHANGAHVVRVRHVGEPGEAQYPMSMVLRVAYADEAR